VLAINLTSVAVSAQKKRLLQIDDLFAVKNIVDLQLSPSGNEVLYVQEETKVRENCYVKTIWRIPTNGNGQLVRLTDNDKDYSPRWSPDGKKVAFLSTRSGSSQVWLLDVATTNVEKITDAPRGIISFKWSPNGEYLAYTSQEEWDVTFEKNIQNTDKGVVIDKETFVIYRLMGNQVFLNQEKNTRLFLLNFSSRRTELLSEIKQVEDFEWAPDSSALAITAKPARGFKWMSDIVAYFVKTHQLKVLLKGQQGDQWDNMYSYTSPVWSPDGKRLLVIFRNPKDRWSSVPRIDVYDLERQKLSSLTNEYELEPYLSRFFWNTNDNIYFENTIRGDRGLFSLSPSNGQVKTVINSDACEDQFSFSHGNQKVSYVKESLHEPPEIYVSDFPFETKRKLTSLNSGFDAVQLPQTERVRWTSPDGVRVEGILFKPIDYANDKSYPLLVLVHGGPNIAIENRYEPYSIGTNWVSPSWIWPYPFRIFANRGYAVFLPDYRGSASYGKKFRETRDILKDPSADIVSGVQFLIKKGLADPNNIGILGQSHGGWLAPSVMAHNRIFKAASFAEGGDNLITNYAQMPGWANLNVHDYYYNGSPYDNPQRYIELSPVFALKGLTTPTLLEYGERSLAVQGLELQSALWREGVPHELVIYPKTGHNITSPVLLLESANRNLDWFDYWMFGRKDPDPSKQEQYARWEAMKLKMDKMRMRNRSIQAAQPGGPAKPNLP